MSDVRQLVTTTDLPNLLSGLIGTAIGALVTFVAVVCDQRRENRKEQNKRKSGAGAFLVLPDGTFYVQNSTDEPLVMTVTQKRLFESLDGTLGAESKRREIYRRLDSKEYLGFYNDVRDTGSVKFYKISLSSGERLEIPDCEMFGYDTGKIQEVIVATVIEYFPLGSGQFYKKLYIHRFTGSGQAEPRGRWVCIATDFRYS